MILVFLLEEAGVMEDRSSLSFSKNPNPLLLSVILGWGTFKDQIELSWQTVGRFSDSIGHYFLSWVPKLSLDTMLFFYTHVVSELSHLNESFLYFFLKIESVISL